MSSLHTVTSLPSSQTLRPSLQLACIGLTRYTDALALQRDLRDRRKAGAAPDTLILTEHHPVLTVGSHAGLDNLLIPEASLAARGIDLVHVERGGDITYHGPGQLIAYPILDLTAYGRDVRRYVYRLEETAIQLLATYGVTGIRKLGTPGVWAGARKIASVGVHISRWVTLHGIAINLDLDLAPFDLINPCGLAGMEMTSVAKEAGAPAPIEAAMRRYTAAFESVFACRITED
jgi:lipoate-protein ligase B